MIRLFSFVILVGTLSGCMGALAGIGTAASVAGAFHSFYQAGSDLVAATAAACQEVPAAKVASARLVVSGARSTPGHLGLAAWVDPVCNWISPDNPAINVSAPAYIGRIVAQMEAKGP